MQNRYFFRQSEIAVAEQADNIQKSRDDGDTFKAEKAAKQAYQKYT